MKIKNINFDLLKNRSLKIIKKGIIGILILSTLVGCSIRQSGYESHSSYTQEITEDTDSFDEEAFFAKVYEYYNQPDGNSDLPDEKTDDTSVTFDDVSDNYDYMYVGDNSNETIRADLSDFIEYKDTDNAFTREESTFDDSMATVTSEDYYEYIDYLDSEYVDMPYSDLFNLEHLHERLTTIDAQHTTRLELEDGRIDPYKLYLKVKENNARIELGSDYYNLPDDKLKYICEIISSCLNNELEQNNYIDLDSLLCNLSSLEIFGEDHITNARITYSTTLLVSENSIETLQSMISDALNAYDMTIQHEANHLFQINCEHEVDKSKGNIIGFNQKWSDEPINSLFWNWYFEASAETLMSNQTGEENIVYENQTNYLKYLKLTLLLDDNFRLTSLEDVSVSRNRDDFYKIYGAQTQEDKLKIDQIMYAIELIQNENDDFEKVYIAYMGLDSSSLSSEEWVNIKRELKVGICTNLSTIFYRNLLEYVCSNTTSLNDIYYLISVYEAEIESHITYDSIDRFYINSDFMESYIRMQNNFFKVLKTANGYSYDELLDGFNNYSFKNGRSLPGIPTEKIDFIEVREKELTNSTTTNIRTYYDILSKQYEQIKTLDLS